VGAEGVVVGGTVRLYPLDEAGLWQGDRLAVLPVFRRTSLGGALVRFAVRTAGGRRGARVGAGSPPAPVPVFPPPRRALGSSPAPGGSRQGAAAASRGREPQPMAIALSADPDG